MPRNAATVELKIATFTGSGTARICESSLRIFIPPNSISETQLLRGLIEIPFEVAT